MEAKFVSAIDAPNLEVREHNIVSDPLDEVEPFDLVHTRAVLDHLPKRDVDHQPLVEALRPGGWLVVLGGDFSTVHATGLPIEESEFFDDGYATVVDAARAVGFDPLYGRRPGAAFRAAGLSQESTEGSIFEWDAHHPLARLYTLTFQRLRPIIVESQALSEADFDLVTMMTASSFHGLSNALFAARGSEVADSTSGRS